MAHADKTFRVPNHALVLICDSRKALVFRNAGSPEKPSLELVDMLEADPNPPTRDHGTDRPGRTNTADGRLSAVEQTDWHEKAQADFARKAAGLIEKTAAAHAATALALVAPPRMLSDLRDALPAALRPLVAGELAADLTKMPVAEMASHLRWS
jgi:protein required for attachment to host cells